MVDEPTQHFDVLSETDDVEAEVAADEDDFEDPSLTSVDAAEAPEVKPEPVLEPSPAPPADERGDADLLEDTPDFLAESPEHDRLWFEQAPPKDFDFDDDK